MNTQASQSLLVQLVPEKDAERLLRESTNLCIDLRGTIEVCGQETSFTVGEFENAIFLIPDLATIASGLRQLREGALVVEAWLTEAPSLWFLRQKRSPHQMDLVYKGRRIEDLAIAGVEQAFESASHEFFQWALLIRELDSWDSGSREYVSTITSVWPTLEPTLLPQRKPRG